MKKYYLPLLSLCFIAFFSCKQDPIVEPEPKEQDTIPVGPKEVLEVDSLYRQTDYTVPSFTALCVAKETARENPTEEKFKAMYDKVAQLQPKENPYCMVANINGDPKTRMAFCWFTNEGITQGEVQLVAKADANEADFESGAITIPAETTTTKAIRYSGIAKYIVKASKIGAGVRYKYVSHKALAEGLTPGTDYSWRVGFDGHWSKIAHFRTEDPNRGEFSFLIMSDSHIENPEYINQARRCAMAAVATCPDARFCLFPGDFVEDGTAANSEWEWEQWFETSLNPVIMQMPIVPTDGNHDDSNNLNYTYHFNTDNQFNKTYTDKPQFEGIIYSFTYGDALFLVYSMQDFWRESYSYTLLTSTYLDEHVGPWFRAQVAANPDTKYRISLSHFNIFSGSSHSIDEEPPLFRACMLPVMKDCEIDVALQGHDHCYEVIGPVDPDNITPLLYAITDREEVTVDKSTDMTGYRGGTYRTDEGTLYFIGATCGRKRYYPYGRETMDNNFEKHGVRNYFDLFTGMFGQPGAPVFTKITVKEECLEFNSYTADDDNGSVTLFNTMRVVRTMPHSLPQ